MLTQHFNSRLLNVFCLIMLLVCFMSCSTDNGSDSSDATDESDTVRLILSGVTLSSASSAPIFVNNAEKVIIVLTENTENTLTDASTYVYASTNEDQPNAAIFSKSDLTIYGSGKLIVDGNYNDGCKQRRPDHR